MIENDQSRQPPAVASPITSLSLKDHAVPAAYVLSHPSTGKRYVGSTVNLYNRVCLHKSRLKAGTHDNRPLQEAYNNNARFDLSAILTDSKEKALDLEQQLLDEGHVCNDLFNIATDARRSMAGKTVSEEVRKVLLEQAKVKNVDPVFRARLSEKMKVVMNDPDLKSAQAARAKKMMDDPAHKAKMAAALSRPVTIDGVHYSSIKEAAAQTGINYYTLVSRFRRQKNHEER